MLWYRFASVLEKLIEWTTIDGLKLRYLPVRCHPEVVRFHELAKWYALPWVLPQELIEKTANEVVRFRTTGVRFSTVVINYLKSCEWEGQTYLSLMKAEQDFFETEHDEKQAVTTLVNMAHTESG